jgi:hypothetical protein
MIDDIELRSVSGEVGDLNLSAIEILKKPSRFFVAVATVLNNQQRPFEMAT